MLLYSLLDIIINNLQLLYIAGTRIYANYITVFFTWHTYQQFVAAIARTCIHANYITVFFTFHNYQQFAAAIARTRIHANYITVHVFFTWHNYQQFHIPTTNCQFVVGIYIARTRIHIYGLRYRVFYFGHKDIDPRSHAHCQLNESIICNKTNNAWWV